MIVERIKTDEAEKVVLSRLAPLPDQIRSNHKNKQGPQYK